MWTPDSVRKHFHPTPTHTPPSQPAYLLYAHLMRITRNVGCHFRPSPSNRIHALVLCGYLFALQCCCLIATNECTNGIRPHARNIRLDAC